MTRRRSMTARVVSGVTWGWSQAYATGRCMGMRSQGIHVARFTTDLQLVLDEGIVRPRRVRRRMMRCSLEGTPTRRTGTTGGRTSGRTTTALATVAAVVGSSGSGARFGT